MCNTVSTVSGAQVCARLGLVSLAYLWHQPQAALLDGMVADGLAAVLVKVAALGLDPGRHLGQPIAAMRPILHRLRRCGSQARLPCLWPQFACANGVSTETRLARAFQTVRKAV